MTNQINSTQLAEILENVTKSTTISIEYVVDDARSKVKNGQKQVQKRVRIKQVFLNHDYTQKVKRLSGDENFVAEELKGKKRICSTLLQSLKTGKLLLDGKILVSESREILAYYHNNRQITAQDAEKLNLWGNSYYSPKPKSTMGRGRVSEDKDFGIINTALDNIKYIKLLGQEYVII
jgi:hypothetical protein